MMLTDEQMDEAVDEVLTEEEVLADEIEVNKKPRKKVDIDDDGPEPVKLHGPVKAPAVALYWVPEDASFGAQDYREAEDLRTLAVKIIADCSELSHLSDMPGFTFLWKRKGGQAKGAAVQGKTIKLSGLPGYLSQSPLVVWLAADECRGWTRREVEALLYHELRHIARDAEGKLSLVPHDVEAFASEIERYGLWQPNLRTFGKAVRQLALDEAS